MSRRRELLKAITEPIFEQNPVALKVLGVCSALAVTTGLRTALVMSGAVAVVLCTSNVAVSLIRNHVPPSIRIVVQLTIIASLVIGIDPLLRAFAFGTSRQLSVFVGLIITNCIIMGRAEAYAMQHPPGLALLDGIGNSLGFAFVLILVASLRELLGAGQLMGVQVLTPVAEGGWYQPNGLMVLAPGAFFILGLLVWVLRTWKPHLVEEEEV